MNRPTRLLWLGALSCLALTACDAPEQDQTTGTGNQGTEPPSNRIDVPAAVRKNLGIEFAKVERRNVTATLRLPAQVELLPTATRHYRAPLAGRVTLHVESLQKVAAGDLLYTLDSHEWRDMQRELGMARNKLTVSEAKLEAMTPLLQACEEHERSLRQALSVTNEYITTLQQAESNVGGQGARLKTAMVEQSRLSAQIAEASEKHTETQTRIKELTAVVASERDQIDLLLAGAAATLGISKDKLAAGEGDQAGWRTITNIEVRAEQAGVVDDIAVANGNIVAAHGHVLATVDPSRVRCHARALQSDLGDLQEGLDAWIVPAGTSKPGDRVAGKVQLGPTGDANTRTIDLFVAPTADDLQFVRPGLAVFVEVITKKSDGNELVIPKSCVLPDGLDRVFFRRDPKDKDKVIRIVGDFGHDDGKWIEVLSGIADGDEVVAAGAFELVLASSDNTPKGGHFHADGTWHADGEDHD